MFRVRLLIADLGIPENVSAMPITHFVLPLLCLTAGGGVRTINNYSGGDIKLPLEKVRHFGSTIRWSQGPNLDRLRKGD